MAADRVPWNVLLLPGLYFSALLLAAGDILWHWSPLRARPALVAGGGAVTPSSLSSSGRLAALGALPFALGALRLTWGLIFAFFAEHTSAYGCPSSALSLFTCRTPAWLAESGGETFVEAYVQVTDDPGGWVWSSQLLMWVVPGCIHLHVESVRLGMPRRAQLAYLVLGFLGAISVALPLWMAHASFLRGSPKFQLHSVAEPQVGLFLVVPSCVAIVSAMALPHTVHTARTTYVTCLAALHFVLMVPSLLNGIRPPPPPTTARPGASLGRSPPPPPPRRPGAPRPRTGSLPLALCYAGLCGAAAVQHVQNCLSFAFDHRLAEEGGQAGGSMPWPFSAITTAEAASSFPALLAASWSSSCQASISSDAVLTSLACVAYMLQSAPPPAGRTAIPPVPTWVFVLLSPVLSVGSSFAAFLAAAEMNAMRLSAPP